MATSLGDEKLPSANSSGRDFLMRKLWSLAVVATLISPGVPAAAFSGPIEGRSPEQGQAQFGSINGTARAANGDALPNYKIHARDSATGAVVAQATSNGTGSFSIAGLAPGNYVVELVNTGGHAVGLSSSVAVAAGSVATVAVTATA